MQQLINIVLMVIIAIVAVLLVFSVLNNNILSVNESAYNSFNNVLMPKQQAMSDVINYMDYNKSQYDLIMCNDLMNNAEQSRFPELACTQGNYFQYSKLGGQVSNYVSSEDSSIGKSLTKDENDIMLLSKDRDAYINRQYVADFLEYMAANPPPITVAAAELFGSVPSAAKPESFENTKLLFPTESGDFYGNYEVDIGQFVILDGIMLHLDYQALIIKDVNDKELMKLQVNELKKVEFNKMPTTTIAITFTSFTKNTKAPLNKLNLLRDIGLDGNIIYLFGNNGVYRMYNYYKTLIFKLNRLTQE